MMAEFASLWSFPAAAVERLGWVLVHSLWQFALVAALAGAAAGAMRRSSAAARYGMLVVAMTSLVAAPVVTWSLQVQALADVERVEFAPANPPAEVAGLSVSSRAARTRNPAANGVDPAATRGPSEPLAAPARGPHTGVPLATAWFCAARSVLRPWLAWIVAGWSLGVAACSFRPLLGGYALWRLQRRGVSPAGDEVLDASRRVSVRLGLRQAVRVLQSTVAPMPIALGWLRPVILLPVALVTSMPAAQLEAILAHELAHVRRHDFLVNLLQTLVETVFFYHPAVWWLSRRIRVEREHCCDDLVVQVLGNRVEYGRALVAVEESRGPSPLLAVGVTDGSLLARVRRIAAAGQDQGVSSWGDRWPLLSLGMTCTLLAATALWVGVGSASDQPSERDAAAHAAKRSGAVNEPAAVAAEQPSRSAAGGKQGPTEPSPAARPSEAWSVAGRVVDEAGRPLAGVVVSAHTGMGTLFQTGKAETSADGEYRFDFGPGLRSTDGIELQVATISAHKPGYFERNLSRQGDLLMARRQPEGEIGRGKKTKDDVILPGQTRRLDFVMLPAARLAGTLIDMDSRPLAGYGVSLTGEELPPSSSVIASVKTDDKGRFSISEIPIGFAFQILVEPAKREPPWNAWASGPFRFAAGEADLSIRQGDTEIVAERFELQVIGAGVNWRQALQLGASQQKLDAAGRHTASGTRLRAATLRLTLDPGDAPEAGSAKPADESAGQPNRVQVGEERDSSLENSLSMALARAAAFIESQRSSDGGWRSGPTAGAYRDGMTALCALALLRAGRTPDDAAVKESLDRLQQVRPEYTYSVALHSVALCAADPTKHREVIRRNVAWLAETQTAEGEASGGWSYGPQRSQRSDGSNTRFAVWALNEAARVGVPAPEATWRAAAEYWLRSQEEDGSWGYMPQLDAGTVTMTLAGIASLAAARRSVADEAAQHAIDAAIQRAWRWHDDRFSVEQLGRGSPWQFYSLQALGLAASLTDHRRIGESAWREQALPLLLRLQDVEAGSWQGQAAEPPLVATSLAILSLTSVP